MSVIEKCPCCSEESYADCCEPIVAGNKVAQSPLELMRSRYSAHVQHNMDHIMRTMSGRALKLFDREKTEEEWFELCNWQKLEIVKATDNIVEFKAFYDFEGKDFTLHERSKFQKTDGQWYYVSGQNMRPKIEISDKVGRNDPCTCGSGKKYKKCCG